MSEVFGRIAARIEGCRHPLLLILLVGIIIRMAVGSLAIVYDSDYWAIVIRNLETGNGLYGLEGYYYTPVWGYVLGGVAAFQNMFMDLGESAVRITEALFIEGCGPYFSATIPSLALIYSVKFPLFCCDLITAEVVRRLVLERTGNGRRSLAAFALVFLSPVLLMSTGVIAMPDTISAMFAVLTIYCLRKGYPLIGGMTFALAVLVKFFPAFMIFALVGYMVSNARREGRRPVADIALAVLGSATMTLLIFLPQIMDGSVAMCFQFLGDRSGFSEGDGILDMLIGSSRLITYAAVLVIAAYLGLKSLSADGDPFDTLMRNCLFTAALVLIYPPTTQYIVILVPFLAYWIAASDRGYMLGWKLLALGAPIYVLASVGSALMPLAVWAGFPDMGSAVHLFQAWYSPVFAGIAIGNMQFVIGGVLQCSAIIIILLRLCGIDPRKLMRRRSVGDEQE